MPDHPTSRPIASQRGLTLVEVMITLTIAAILLTWAVPSLQDFIVRNRMSTEVNNLVATLYVARSESVKRLEKVKVCPANSDFSGCSGTDWEKGWIIFTDVNNNNVINDTDTLIQEYPSLPSRFKIQGSADRPYIVFQPNGRSTGYTNTFKFCDSGGVANVRNVILSNEGRVRTEVLPTNSC